MSLSLKMTLSIDGIEAPMGCDSVTFRDRDVIEIIARAASESLRAAESITLSVETDDCDEVQP